MNNSLQMSTGATANASIESQLDCALDLMRRLPPQQVEKNLSDLIDLVPDLTEELLAAVDQPLKVIRDRTAGKDYLLCDYNRDGDSYRSPWTNTYFPPFEGKNIDFDLLNFDFFLFFRRKSSIGSFTSIRSRSKSSIRTISRNVLRRWSFIRLLLGS